MAENDELLLGRNSVMEALKSGRPINKILIAKGERHGAVREIIGAARAKGLVVQEVEPGKLDIMTGKAKHQGVLAMVAPVKRNHLCLFCWMKLKTRIMWEQFYVLPTLQGSMVF